MNIDEFIREIIEEGIKNHKTLEERLQEEYRRYRNRLIYLARRLKW